MNRRFRVVIATFVGALVAVAALMGAGQLLANPLASNSVPEIVNYQGYLTDSGGNPISSTVTLQFSIWDASSAGNQLWSETHNNVPVSGGYFSVLLGSQGTPLTPSVFSSTTRYLEVTFGATTFTRQRFASVPYALVAHQATEAITSTYATSATYATTATYALNAPGGGGGVTWSHVVVVAKSGGDYTTINDALNAIAPSPTERYLILVMPGVYEEQVVLEEYVHLKGAGVANTVISSQANTGNFNDDAAATLLVPANSQVSDLRVRNNATTNDGVALKIDGGNAETILNNVQIRKIGDGGDQSIALYLAGGSPMLSHVDISVTGGVASNWGIFNSVSSPKIHDSILTATGNAVEGLRINGGAPNVADSIIKATNGSNGKAVTTSGGGGNVEINRSTIEGDAGAGASFISSDSIEFYVGASLVKGDADVTAPADITCAQSYDRDYVDLDANCQ